MISQKIGKADENKQFRKLFKEDDDFHDVAARGPARQLAGGQGMVRAGRRHGRHAAA